MFVETVAKEDQTFDIDANMTLDALFGVDEDVVEGDSSKNTSQKEQPGTPNTNAHGNTGTGSAEGQLFTPPHLTVSTSGTGDAFSGGVDAGLESPAERIALTPVRKLPPGSGMRKVRRAAITLHFILSYRLLFFCGR